MMTNEIHLFCQDKQNFAHSFVTLGIVINVIEIKSELLCRYFHCRWQVEKEINTGARN